ncbi:MAG: hypothetical protein KBB88_00630 [Candidatus Pacebacteria bacterium]|nr:hypothetical protein [Candidatus Paceibacterota bacterium]
MEKQTKNWWVVFATCNVQTRGDFDMPVIYDHCKLASEFVTETEAVELACSYVAIVCGHAIGKPAQFTDEPNEFVQKMLQEIRRGIVYEDEQNSVYVDRDGGSISFDCAGRYESDYGLYIEFKVQLQCLDFDGKRNFAKEVKVARTLAEKLTS